MKGIVSRHWECLQMIFIIFIRVFTLYVKINHQRTSTGPGIQTVLRNEATPGVWSCTSILSARRSVGTVYCLQEVIAGSCQILPDRN